MTRWATLYLCASFGLDVMYGGSRTTDNIVNRPGENGTAGLREFPFMALLGYDTNKYDIPFNSQVTYDWVLQKYQC